jgi:hypothetical protein
MSQVVLNNSPPVSTLPEHPSHITVAGQSCLILTGSASTALSKSRRPVRL